MQRRNFLVGIGSASVGGSALLGSGAFSRVESHRNVTVEVAEDPSAYLGLDKCDTPNGSYVDIDDDGHLEILMNPDNPTIGNSSLGSGVNSNSISNFDSVFQICNQGKQEACVWIADDDAWPTVPDDEEMMGGERRVEFYLNGFRDESVIGESNGITLAVGECVCIGLETRTFDLAEGDMLLDELDNEVQIVADVDSACGAETVCPNLTGSYQCTTYAAESDGYSATGTRFEIQNTGDATQYNLAVANSPGAFESASIGTNTITTEIADASFPNKALIAWNIPDGCSPVPDAQTWDEYKGENGLENLADWYEEFGTEGGVPDEAPTNIDDDLVVEVRDIPEEGVDPAVGPDSFISNDQWPAMSDDAADLGWITCEAYDEQNLE